MSRTRVRREMEVEARTRGLRPGSRDSVVARANRRDEDTLHTAGFLASGLLASATMAVTAGTPLTVIGTAFSWQAGTGSDDPPWAAAAPQTACLVYSGGPAKALINYNIHLKRTTGAAGWYGAQIHGIGLKNGGIPTGAGDFFYGQLNFTLLNVGLTMSAHAVLDITNDDYISIMLGSFAGTVSMDVYSGSLLVSILRGKTSA